MNFGKVFRDVIILIVIGASFYFVTIAATLFSGEAPPASSDFSVDRTQADDLLMKKDYRSAIPHLQKLVKEDPFNSHAMYWLAVSAGQVQEELRLRNDASLAPEIEKYTKMSVEAFEKTLDYPSYANRARFNLAIICAIQNDDEQVISILRDAVEDGFYTRRGLANYERFSSLKDNRDFRSIVSDERQNARNYARKKRGSVSAAN